MQQMSRMPETTRISVAVHNTSGRCGRPTSCGAGQSAVKMATAANAQKEQWPKISQSEQKDEKVES